MSYHVTSDATKKILTASLKKFMELKPLNKISVREIIEDCGLNRQTFYYHFEDIYDQVKWMYSQEAIVLLAQHDGVLVWQDGLLQIFNYLQENRTVCLCALHSMGREHLKRFFYTDLRSIIEKAIMDFGQEIKATPEYKDFLAHFFTISLAAVMESWLIEEIELTPKELINFIDITMKDQLSGAQLRTSNS